MKTQLLKLTDIRCDSGTQCRSGVSEETVSDYAERMQSGDSFPPVVLFFDGNQYHMADGFHRYLAASRNGSDELPAVLHQGTAQDALWYGLGSNRVNGLRLSPGDKRRAVELALDRFPTKSQQEIADHVGCSQKYVSQMKEDIIPRYNVPPTRKDSKGRNQPTRYKPKAAQALDEDQQAVKPEPVEVIREDSETRAYRVSLKIKALTDAVKETLASLNPTHAEMVQAACAFRKLANDLDKAALMLVDETEDSQ